MKKVLIMLLFLAAGVFADNKSSIHATLLTGIAINYNDTDSNMPIILKDDNDKLYFGLISNPSPHTHRLKIILNKECDNNQCKPLNNLDVYDIDGQSGILANLLVPNPVISEETERLIKLVEENGTLEEKKRIAEVKKNFNIDSALQIEAGKNLIINNF